MHRQVLRREERRSSLTTAFLIERRQEESIILRGGIRYGFVFTRRKIRLRASKSQQNTHLLRYKVAKLYALSSGYGYVLSVLVKGGNWIHIQGRKQGKGKRRETKTRTKDNMRNGYSCWHKIELLLYFSTFLYQMYKIKSNRIAQSHYVIFVMEVGLLMFTFI